MKLAEIVRAVNPLAVEGPLDHEITGIAYDSRRVMPGNLFVAVRGERTDGHRFVEAAIDRGAAAVLLERDAGMSPRATRIKVSDTRRTMALVSAQFYQHPSQQLKVVGVTGTNGKTTTAFMVRSILEQAGLASGLLGTVQYQIGHRIIPAARTTPESVEIQEMMSQMLRAGCRAVSMEVSSHALDQHRVDSVDFDVAVFTNLSQDHLDYHGTMQNYFEAKAKLFSALGTLRKKGRAVVNADSPYGRQLIARLGGEHAVLSYGVSSEAIIRAEDVRVSSEGTYFVARTPRELGGSIAVSLPLIGRYNVSNALAAMGAALALGIDLPTIERALAGLKPVPGRLELVEVAQPFRVYIDYAHTAEALRNVLLTVGELTRGRLIVVFGCGGDRDKGKRKPMGQVACELADFSILTSDNPRSEDPREILREIESGFGPDARNRYQVIVDRREAIERALDIARPGDAVVVAGKGHEMYQEFADTVVPFNDRQVVEEYFGRSEFRWTPCA
jgi:UDP-N-acetylmuramoyl-L-alanyl-D-glutamate--2,6-diaminopimelate ligase